MLRIPMPFLPAPVQAVLDLFRGPLANVRFADIDSTGLADLAAEVEAAAANVEEQESKLAELRQQLAQRQEALLVLAQRALSYARVYAEGDSSLTEELNRIALARPAKIRKASAAKPAEPAPSSASAAEAGAAETQPQEPHAEAAEASEASDEGAAEGVSSSITTLLEDEPVTEQPAPRKGKRRDKSERLGAES